MKITWISPYGAGWSIAARMRDAGHKVVYYNPRNKNGAGYLPSVTDATWMDYATKSDLVIVDDTPESRQTRRSWEPSNLTMDLQQVRHKGIEVLGPTPMTELLENDDRYFRKVLGRLGLNRECPTGPVQRITASRDPLGKWAIVFRHRHLLGDNLGPSPGNLADIVVPLPDGSRIGTIVQPLVDQLYQTGYSGYVNVSLALGAADYQIEGVRASFLYPAIFSQLGALLGGAPEGIGLAVSLLNFDATGTQLLPREIEELQGVFLAECHRDLDGKPTVHGEFVGAVVGHDPLWQTVQGKVYHYLSSIVRPGWGFRSNGVGSNVAHVLSLLQKWGYLS